MSSKHFVEADIYENQDRMWLLGVGILKLILFIAIFIIWVLGFVVTFPAFAWGYGFIYHLPEIVGIIFAIICSFSTYPVIIIIGLLVAIMIFIVDMFAFGILLYTILICIIKSIPASSCKNTLPAIIIIAFLGGALAIASFFILWSNARVSKRLNNAVIYKVKNK
jgi:hypothetical protein